MKSPATTQTDPNPPRMRWIAGFTLILPGIALGLLGIYLGDTDDAPGAALLGIVLMIALTVFGVRSARRRPRAERHIAAHPPRA